MRREAYSVRTRPLDVMARKTKPPHGPHEVGGDGTGRAETADPRPETRGSRGRARGRGPLRAGPLEGGCGVGGGGTGIRSQLGYLRPLALACYMVESATAVSQQRYEFEQTCRHTTLDRVTVRSAWRL